MYDAKKSMTVKVILLIVSALVIAEVLALVWLATSVDRYRNFWSNKATETGEITYLAMGDSAAQGIGASSPMRGYVGIIAKRLEQKTGKKVRVINTSRTGATLSDYLIEQVPQIKEVETDVVTIEIGANDIRDLDQNKFRNEFKQVLASLPEGTFVSNMPLFDSRPGSTANAKLASAIIYEELQKYPKLQFVDLQKQTIEHQSIFGFAPDLFHPNNLSYKNWADAFWLQIENQL